MWNAKAGTRINSYKKEAVVCGVAGRFLLLHNRCLLLARAGQSLLDQPREFFLASELDLGVFLGHPDGTVAGDFRSLNARSTYLLQPSDVGASQGVRTQTREIAALGRRGPL